MLHCSAQFRILFINANFVAEYASLALASSATATPTFNVEEEVVVIRNGWTAKMREDIYIYIHIYIYIFIYRFIISFLTKTACCRNIEFVLRLTALSYICILNLITTTTIR